MEPTTWTRVTDVELAELYGGLVFDEAEPLVLELHELEKTLDRAMEDEGFRNRVTTLRNKVFREVTREHKGAFDGWFKRVVHENYGPTSEWAQKYGTDEDWPGRFIYIVMPRQSDRHNMIVRLFEYAEMPPPTAETKTAVRPAYEKAKVKFTAGKPGRAEGEGMGSFLKRLTVWKGESWKIGGLLEEAEEWFRERQTPRTTEPKPTDPKDILQHEIDKLEQDLRDAQADEGKAVNTRNYALAAQKAEEAKGIQRQLEAKRAELGELEKAEQLKVRVQAAASVVAGQPAPGTFPTVTHDVAAEMKQVLGVQTELTLENLPGEIVRLQGEWTKQNTAAATHEARVTAFQNTISEFVVAGKPDRVLQPALELQQATIAAGGARQIATKIQERIAELQLRLGEAERLKAASGVTVVAGAPTGSPQQQIAQIEARIVALNVQVAAIYAEADGLRNQGMRMEAMTKEQAAMPLIMEINKLRNQKSALEVKAKATPPPPPAPPNEREQLLAQIQELQRRLGVVTVTAQGSPTAPPITPTSQADDEMKEEFLATMSKVSGKKYGPQAKLLANQVEAGRMSVKDAVAAAKDAGILLKE